MEFESYPSIDNPYTGTVYITATSIYDSQNPSFFNEGEVFVDIEGGVYIEQVFDNYDEAKTAFDAQVENAAIEAQTPKSWPYDTITVFVQRREYENGWWTDSYYRDNDGSFENSLVEREDFIIEAER